MNNKKPDALLVLAVLFAVGILFSAISHTRTEGHVDSVAGYQGQVVPFIEQ